MSIKEKGQVEYRSGQSWLDNPRR